MSIDSSIQGEETEIIYVAEIEEASSSADPPMEEWSSLLIEISEENKKKLLCEQGLYQPGSGEICTKYIPMSDSSVFRHVYYNYPSLKDPGIMKVLLEPIEPITYARDGQDLYMAICKEMLQCPVRIFHKGLLGSVIDLSYYCVNPVGVRAMAIALRLNETVTTLDLTDNFLSTDACYHLGEMLSVNNSLTTLNLSGCRIGVEGLRNLLAGLTDNYKLNNLNLDKNQLGDAGGALLARAVFFGIKVKELSLSYNELTGNTLDAFIEAFDTHNRFTALDLSWNNLFTIGPTCRFLNILSENQSLQKLNLSWNALKDPRIGIAIKNLLSSAKNLSLLDLSNNRLGTDVINKICLNMATAKKLVTLDLSNNPLTVNDSLKLMETMKRNKVKLKRLLLDNADVSPEFLAVHEEMMAKKSKKDCEVTWGQVIRPKVIVDPDIRNIVLNRVEYLMKKPKKKVDFALVVYKLLKENKTEISAKEFGMVFKALGPASLDDDLMLSLISICPGTFISAKERMLNLVSLADFLMRKWPERKLPPTPPPTPPPPTQVKKDKGKKGVGKKGKK